MSDSAGGRRIKAKLRDDQSEGTAKHTRLAYNAALRTGCVRVTSQPCTPAAGFLNMK